VWPEGVRNVEGQNIGDTDRRKEVMSEEKYEWSKGQENKREKKKRHEKNE
jgi:hypothetical protein